MPGQRRTPALADHTRETVLARELHRAAMVVPPWLAWAWLLPVALVLHWRWPWPAAAWSVGTAGAVLAVIAAHLGRHRKTLLGKTLAPFTLLAGAAWLAWADLAGVTSGAAGVWFIGGGSLALAWSMWLHHHGTDDATGAQGLFAEAAKHTAHPKMKFIPNLAKSTAAKVQGMIVAPKGVTHKQVADEMAALESAAELPPGSLKVTGNEGNARLSHVSLINPQALAKPRLWTPWNEGTSIAGGIRYGRFVNSDDIIAQVVNDHVLAQGCTGSAKTTGYAYCEIGGTVIHPDAAVFVVDLAKSRQFFGIWEPALHGLVTTAEGATDLIRRLNAAREPRTNWLGEMGLHQWAEGCGLLHVTVIFEEASWVFTHVPDAVIEKILIPNVLALRSAGIRLVFMIQRAHFEQMPTTIRTQLSRICLGVLESGDANQFGLSEYQSDHGCDPSRWGRSKPGMTYLDLPGFTDEQKLTEGRYDWWGPNNDLAAHVAAAHPATDRWWDKDPLTGLYLDLSRPLPGTTPKPAKKEAPVREDPADELADLQDLEDDPEPTGYDDGELWEPDPDEAGPVPTEADWAPRDSEHRFGPPPQDRPRLAPNPEDALDALANHLRRLAEDGTATVTLADLAPLTEPTSDQFIGRSRTWLYPAMTQLEARGVVVQRDNPRRYDIQDAA